MKVLYPVLAALLAAAAQAPMAHAQANPQTPVQSVATMESKKIAGPGGLGIADTTWMQQAARSANFEFQASRLATKKAQSSQIRAFARTIVDDHARAKADLHDIARANEVMLPEQPDPAQRKDLAHLESLNGAAFDAAYLKVMQAANQGDLSAEQAEARTVHDHALLQYVQRQQKMDQKHAQSAAQLEDAQTASRKH